MSNHPENISTKFERNLIKIEGEDSIFVILAKNQYKNHKKIKLREVSFDNLGGRMVFSQSLPIFFNKTHNLPIFLCKNDVLTIYFFGN